MKKTCALVGLILVMATSAWAKPNAELVAALQHAFTPADFHKSLVNSQHRLDMNKAHGFAVIKMAGIPASQAYWFIARQDYEFRPVFINGNKTKTHIGKVDVTLEPGTVMLVISTDVQGNTVNIRLLSRDVIAEKGGTPTPHDTRAGVSMVFRFSDLQMTAADAPAILSKIEEFIVPADSATQAEQISLQIAGGRHVTVAKAPTPSSEWVTAPAMPAKTVPAATPTTTTAPAAAVTVATQATGPAIVPTGVVHTGMSMADVKRIKGDPKRITNRGNTVIYDYGEHEVIFVGGKVHDIRWK